MGKPEIRILDEPTVGLDPKQINEIRTVIKELGRERTIILSSHILPEVSAICERVIIINSGKIAAIDTTENLAKSYSGSGGIKVRVEGDETAVLDIINGLDGVESVSVKKYDDVSNDYSIETEEEKDIRRELFFELSKNSMPILMLTAQNLTLEDVFLKLTTVEDEVETKEADA